jgi:hypothetical protein
LLQSYLSAVILAVIRAAQFSVDRVPAAGGQAVAK